MTDALSKLRELPKKWRESAKAYSGNMLFATIRCADELEALLPALEQREHIFDPDSCLQDCSCGWKTDEESRRTVKGAESDWKKHMTFSLKPK